MRYKDKETMNRIIQYVDDYFKDYGKTPAMQNIADALKMSISTVHSYIYEMNDRGMIIYENRIIKTPAISRINFSSPSVPLVGSVSCGELLFAEENIETYITIPDSVFGKGEFFALRANGDSMIDAGIDDDDIVIVRKQNFADEGDIVVALHQNDATLKRFYKDNENHKIILHPENKNYKDIILNDCIIQGVAVSVIKML